MENRRNFTRILFSIKAELNIDNIIYPVSIHDISLNGALVTAIHTDKPIKEKLGTLSFCLAENEFKLTMFVVVLHEQGNTLGLKCNAMDIGSVTLLRRLIELNLGDSEQINKELSQLTLSS